MQVPSQPPPVPPRARAPPPPPSARPATATAPPAVAVSSAAAPAAAPAAASSAGGTARTGSPGSQPGAGVRFPAQPPPLPTSASARGVSGHAAPATQAPAAGSATPSALPSRREPPPPPGLPPGLAHAPPLGDSATSSSGGSSLFSASALLLHSSGGWSTQSDATSTPGSLDSSSAFATPMSSLSSYPASFSSYPAANPDDHSSFFQAGSASVYPVQDPSQYRLLSDDGSFHQPDARSVEEYSRYAAAPPPPYQALVLDALGTSPPSGNASHFGLFTPPPPSGLPPPPLLPPLHKPPPPVPRRPSVGSSTPVEQPDANLPSSSSHDNGNSKKPPDYTDPFGRPGPGPPSARRRDPEQRRAAAFTKVDSFGTVAPLQSPKPPVPPRPTDDRSKSQQQLLQLEPDKVKQISAVLPQLDTREIQQILQQHNGAIEEAIGYLLEKQRNSLPPQQPPPPRPPLAAPAAAPAASASSASSPASGRSALFAPPPSVPAAASSTGMRAPAQPLQLDVRVILRGNPVFVKPAVEPSATCGAVAQLVLRQLGVDPHEPFSLWMPHPPRPGEKGKTGSFLPKASTIEEYLPTVTQVVLELKSKRRSAINDEIRATKASRKRKDRKRVPHVDPSASPAPDPPPTPDEFFEDPNSKITITEQFQDDSVDQQSSASSAGAPQQSGAIGGSGGGGGERTSEPTATRVLTLCFETWAVRIHPWSNPTREGELLKQGSMFKSMWNARWIVLAGSRLFIFRGRPSDNEKPSRTVAISGGYVEVVDKAPKGYHCISVSVLDPQRKRLQFFLASRDRDEADQWFSVLKRAAESTGLNSSGSTPAGESSREEQPTLKRYLQVRENARTGFVGLPAEWRQALNECGITEREFYENADDAVRVLRVQRCGGNMNGQPLVQHPPRKTLVSNKWSDLDEVINMSVTPDQIYTDMTLIGEGSFGEVYEATDMRTQQKVAVKKMLLTPKRVVHFISEIKVQKGSEHPNVVKLFDAFKVDDHLWVVLEYMPNGNLTQIIDDAGRRATSLSEPQIAYICCEVLKSLSYIHSMHRIHRDIKSDNVLIGKNGEVKLADFGYAVQLESEEEKRNTICGTPYWMAPEIIQGKKYGKEIDIWSLGVLLMECCDGQPPYLSEAPQKALQLLSTQPLPELKNVERWSQELRWFLAACTQRDPKKRAEAIDLLQHPFLRRTCTPRQFRDQVLIHQKKRQPCIIQ